MQEGFTIAVTGDSNIRWRLSTYDDARFVSLVKIIKSADVAFTQLETTVGDYDGPGVYPAAEGGYAYLRSPPYVIDELKRVGFNMVSLASNHCMDYSYGGLLSTLRALDEAGLPHAGAGKNLGEARAPAYLETRKGRVAMISMCSDFPRWGRAGDSRADMRGRPGVNPLRYCFVVDPSTLETIRDIWEHRLGLNVPRQIVENVWTFRPPGRGNTVYKFIVKDTPECYAIAEESDVVGNLRSIKEARRQADYVLVHLHYHKWDRRQDIVAPAEFVPPFARQCIDAGADLFIGEGTHTLGGIEIYKNKPIFYDPMDFVDDHSIKLPSDYYWHPNWIANPEVRSWEATPADVRDARDAIGSDYRPILERMVDADGSFLGVCRFGDGREVTEVKLHPYTLLSARIDACARAPSSVSQFPALTDVNEGEKIVKYVAKLSSLFRTKIESKDGVGFVELEG